MTTLIKCSQVVTVTHNPGVTEEDESTTVTTCDDEAFALGPDGKPYCTNHLHKVIDQATHHETYDPGWSEEYEIDG
jgi:hypothetical protein